MVVVIDHKSDLPRARCSLQVEPLATSVGDANLPSSWWELGMVHPAAHAVQLLLRLHATSFLLCMKHAGIGLAAAKMAPLIVHVPLWDRDGVAEQIARGG